MEAAVCYVIILGRRAVPVRVSPASGIRVMSWWWSPWTQNPIIHRGGFCSLASWYVSPLISKLGLQSLPSVPATGCRGEQSRY